MWLFIKQIFQLLLAPSRGWEDISAEAMTAEDIQRRGFYPWLAIVALSCFLRLFYDSGATFVTALQHGVAVAGGLFISLYLGRLFLDMTLPKMVNAKINIAKTNVFIIYLTAIVGLYDVIANAMPASMTFLHFLPLLSLLVIFKATTYLDIDQDSTLSFLCLAAAAVIVIPMCVIALLSLII